MKIKVFWDNERIFFDNYEVKSRFHLNFAVAIDDRTNEIVTFFKGAKIQPINYKLIDRKLFKEINESIRISFPVELEKFVESYAIMQWIDVNKFLKEEKKVVIKKPTAKPVKRKITLKKKKKI